jgi:hypothetical protein
MDNCNDTFLKDIHPLSAKIYTEEGKKPEGPAG